MVISGHQWSSEAISRGRSTWQRDPKVPESRVQEGMRRHQKQQKASIVRGVRLPEGSRGTHKASEGIRRHQKEPEGTRRHQKASEGTRRHQKAPEGIRRHQKAPKGTRRHQKESEGIRRNQKDVEGPRRTQRVEERGICMGVPRRTMMPVCTMYGHSEAAGR